MRPFSLLIKPVSADCNMRCKYCFYFDKQRLYPKSDSLRMSDAVLERMISSYMSTDQPQYSFCWQGGEPTLMGTPFFKRVIQLQQKYGKPGVSVANSLQTNGTLIDDELAVHLAKYKFLAGVSLDGPADLHNHFRKFANTNGSHNEVLKGLECLRRNNVATNILTLVSSANVKKGKDVYHYLTENGFFFQQYIPCVEFDEKMQPMSYSISSEEWGNFLCDIFDEWFISDINRVSVRQFDTILSFLINGTRSACQMRRKCSSYLVVEHNGDIYPCDFFVENNWKLGNIMTDTWKTIRGSSKYISFARKKENWCKSCADCEYLTYCMGDCPKQRINGKASESWLCSGWKHFYQHAVPKLKEIAAQAR